MCCQQSTQPPWPKVAGKYLGWLAGYKGGALQLASRGTCLVLAPVAWAGATGCRALGPLGLDG